MLALTVTHAFGDYTPGDVITDKEAMKAALETNPASVVRTKLPEDKPAQPAKTPTKADAS